MSIKELQNLISPKFTEEVLIGALEKNNGLKNMRIKEIILDNKGNSKGDSYISELCRFGIIAIGENAAGKEEEVVSHVLVKVMARNKARRATQRLYNFFENEITFYEKAWPAFREFQKSKQITRKFNAIPNFLAAHFDVEDSYVALEDLSYKGFQTLPRSSGLSFDEALVILKTYAHFHALSFAFKEQKPADFEKAILHVKETYLGEQFYNWYVPFMNSLIEVTRDAVEKELPPVYLEKFNAFLNEDDFYLRISAQCRQRGPLAVLTHGDVWITNLLFKLNENKRVEDVRMIDFQCVRYASLVNDLLLFLYSCVDHDVMQQQWNDLFQEYYKYFVDYSTELGTKNLITLDDIKKGVKNNIAYGIGTAMEARVLSSLPDEDVCDLNQIEGEEAVPLVSVFKFRPFEEQAKRKWVAALIKHVVDYEFI